MALYHCNIMEVILMANQNETDFIEFIDEKDKPEDFPANNREARILKIHDLLSQLIKKPSYKIREVYRHFVLKLI